MRCRLGCHTASHARSEMQPGYAGFYSRAHDAVIHVYDKVCNVIETHEHAGDFKEW